MPGLEVGWGVNAVALGDASRRAAALQTLRTEECRVTGTVFLPSSATQQGAGCQHRILSFSIASHQAADPKGLE